MKSRVTVFAWGFLFALTGLVVLVGGVMLDGLGKALRVTPATPVIAILATNEFWWNAGSDLMKTVGLALIAMGMFNIILDMPGWTKYFRNQLQEVIVNDDYLQTLGVERLRGLVPKIVKAAFGDEQLDREGSFLRYFMDHMFTHLAVPYRENVRVELIVTEHDDSTFHVVDTISYVCRSTRGVIQDEVAWNNDGGLDMKELTMILRYPKLHEQSNAEITKVTATVTQLAQKNVLNHSLKALRQFDGLRVELTAKYHIKKAGLYAWRMPTSTRDFYLSLHYPVTYLAEIETFAPERHLVVTSDGASPGRVTCECAAWMLPDTGVCWSFTKK